MLNNKNVILGISASIAAYKSAHLVRLLKKSGANVQVIQTPKSIDFVTPLTLSTLSNNPVYSEMINEDDTWNSHVDLALWADIMIIAPATAKTLSKMVNGDCSNILLATYLSIKCPVYFAPAMDLDMYKHPSTLTNIKKLQSYSNILIPPDFGELASGLIGEGRMKNPEDIISFLNEDIINKSPLKGISILITAGPTYEHIDKVRYLTNHSSGKMGISLAHTAASLGADVILVIGPCNYEIKHSNIEAIDIVSAADMFSVVIDKFKGMDIGIFAAAVSDFKPTATVKNKIKKSQVNIDLKLEPTIDVLSQISLNKDKSQYIVGFALETDNEIENAKTKLKNKKLDLIVLNSLNDKGAGFSCNTNKITIIDSNNNIELYETKSKDDVSKDIFDKILKLRK